MPAPGKIFPFILAAVVISFLSACGRGPVNRNVSGLPSHRGGPKLDATRIIQPQDDQRFTVGEAVPVQLGKTADTVPQIDSVVFFFAGSREHACLEEPYSFKYSTGNLPVGTLSIRTVVWLEDGHREFHNLQVILLSDLVPENLAYRIENVYPHDNKAYTQGLTFEGGFLYEGTGQYNESSLRKVEIKTGEPVRMTMLAGEIFGEGITIFKDRIYQLTYKSQVGFVYDKETFRRIQKVYYQNKEGWGLTNDENHLIMSDGSNRIYYMDPTYFTEVRQLEVYDNNGPVNRLNELEYIEGKIFANIYGEEVIVIIDPETGKVTGKLDMRGILSRADRHAGIDVFNGIAWDPGRRVMYVTGKYWPSLFEVSINGTF